MKKLFLSGTGLLLILVLFLAFNVFAANSLRTARMDLTEQKLYTLSPGTKNILEGLSDQVRLKFYFSKAVAEDEQVSPVLSFGSRVRELLEEFVTHSKGKITLEVLDPEPDSETEEQAVAAGLNGASMRGRKCYFGVIGTNQLDNQEKFEIFELYDQQSGEFRDEFLEYSATKLVYALEHPKKKVLGILTALPMDGNPMAKMMNRNANNTDPWMIVEALRQSVEVKMFPADTQTIEAGVDVLMVAHPQKLAPATLYAIDQFVLGGGKALVFVDPFMVTQEVPENPQNPLEGMMADRSSTLGQLFDAWGVEMNMEEIAGDKELAQLYPNSKQTDNVDYVVFLGFEGESLAKSDLVTSELKNVMTFGAGVLKAKAGATTTLSPLLETTKSSMRVQKQKLQFRSPPEELLESFLSSQEKLIVGARITGPVKTAFPDGKPAAEGADSTPPDPTPLAPLKESRGDINVIVVADADMLADPLWVRVQNLLGQRFPMAVADNGKFVQNAVENLTGSNDLISVRGRGKYRRPFERVEAIRKLADESFREKEKDLEAKMKDAQDNIDKILSNKMGPGAMILPPEVLKEKERFEKQRNETAKELRRVRLDMRKDIESLKTSLVWWNVAAVPILIALAGLVVWSARRQKMKAARAASRTRS